MKMRTAASLVIGTVLFLFVAEAVYFLRVRGNSQSQYRSDQKIEVELALVSFHSYYHMWPCPAGPLGDNALVELLGVREAKINKQHINFFKKNHVSMNLLDSNGNPLAFQPDDSIGTCSVGVSK